MTCPKCQDYKERAVKTRREMESYAEKLKLANKALFFAEHLMNEIDSAKPDQDIIKTCKKNLKILIPRCEEIIGVKFVKKERFGETNAS